MSQTLTLTISNQHLSDSNNYFVFDENGGSIGRNRNNDFVLSGPEISRTHAIISYTNGAYFLTDKSGNGVFMNDQDEPVGNEKTVRLYDGDNLAMGEYELQVSIGNDDYAQADDDEYTQHMESAEIDSAPTGYAQEELYADSRQQPQDVLGPDPTLVGENKYEEVLGTSNPVPPESNPTPTDVGQARNPTGESRQDWDVTIVETPDDRPITRHEHTEQQPRRHRERDEPAGFDRPAEPTQPERVRSKTAAGGPEHFTKTEPATTETQPLQAFLEGAGLELGELPTESAEALMRLQGKLFRETVRGLMEVLKARSEVKESVDARHTQIQMNRNVNPLKSHRMVDGALDSLIMRRTGHLPPEDAIKEAFQDIKNHQMAMLAGIQEAFESLLNRFDPQLLERKFSRGGKMDDLLPMYKKSHYWERYKQWYAEITTVEDEKDRVEAAKKVYKKLFGDEFRHAYQEQIDMLSSSRDDQRRD